MILHGIGRRADIRKAVAALVMQHIGVVVAEFGDQHIPDTEIRSQRIDERDDRPTRAKPLGAIVNRPVVDTQKIHVRLLLG